MPILNIFTKEQKLLSNQSADLLLLSSSMQKASSFLELFADDKNLYSPALITNAVANLCGFKEITFKALQRANISNAKATFSEGAAFARAYELRGNALILGDISGTLAPQSIKRIQNCISNILSQKSGSAFTLLEECDRVLLYICGFIFEASRRFELILGGDILMAFALKLADTLREELLMRPMSQNITFITTEWALQTQPIEETLSSLSYRANAFYTPFDAAHSEIQELKDIGKNGVLESAAAAAALAYAEANAISQEQIIEEMELIVYMR